jgi:hypothetical protein
MNNDLVALYLGYIDIGFATSTPRVDHEPGAGVYEGSGRRGRVWTKRTLVILSSLFSSWNASAGAHAAGLNSKKVLRFMDFPSVGRMAGELSQQPIVVSVEKGSQTVI